MTSTLAGAATGRSPALADAARLSVLRESGLLDAAAEEAFDRLTRLASALVKAPATFISLVDEQRDFFLSCVGFPDPLAAERQIDGPTFCHLAMESPAPLVIPDTRADAAYLHLPAVAALGVAAYVGVPIRGGGQVLGSFCAVDFVAREWTPVEVETLVELARSAEREIELRRRIRQVEEQGEEMRAQAAELEAQIEDAHDAARKLKWANAELHASGARAEAEREQLRAVFEQAPVAVAVLRGPGHLFESANPGYRRMVGGREVLGKTVAAALPEVVGQGFIALLDGVLETGRPFVAHGIPVTLQESGGEFREHFLDLMYHPLRDDHAAVTGIMVIATDVTDQHHATTIREHERARLARMVAQFPGAVAVLEGPEHRFVAASEQYRHGAGFRELLGRTYREVFPEVEGQGYFDLLDGAYRSGKDWSGTAVRVSWDDDGDGVADEHLVDLLYAPLRDGAGEVDGMAVVYTIVDERERSAEALRASDERYALALRATADVIWDWDLPADCIRWNAALHERFGHQPPHGETSGNWWLDHIHPDDRDGVAGGIHEAIARGDESWTAEYRFQRADGGYADVLDRGHIAQHPDGAPGRMVGAMQDVTEEKRTAQLRLALYEEAQRARADADQANLAKSQFLAQMSHEIRTPINAVVGYVDLLEAGVAGELNAKQSEYVARVKASGRHLLGLVSNVLDLSKAEAGEMQVAQEPTPLLGTAAAALGMVAPAAEAKRVTLRDASTAAGDVMYVGDEDRVRQVAVNLLSNAVRFTGEGGEVTVRCRLVAGAPAESTLEGPGPWLAVEVEDNGQGIPPEAMERIFEPFAQVEGGHTRRAGGTGLGLTISRRFARLMGGDLTVTSELGRGSRFVLWLPTPEGVRAREEAEGAPEPASGPAESWEAGPCAVSGLADLGHLLARHADALTARFGQRLRGDAHFPGAAAIDAAQLENHVATFLLDTGKSLITLDEGRGDPELMQDGTSIQRVIAERHGEQRRRIGWTADHLRREFVLLREEVEGLISREAGPRSVPELAAALAVLYRLLDRAERNGLRAFGAPG